MIFSELNHIIETQNVSMQYYKLPYYCIRGKPMMRGDSKMVVR